MNTKTKFIILTIILAVITFALSRVIWPDPADSIMHPTSAQLPFFMFLSALESVAFGVGVSFLIFGWPMVQKISPENKKGATISFLAIAWLLISWWPHDNMHRVNGENMAGLLRIEYIFHFTLIVSALILARQMYVLLKRITV